MGRLVLFWEGLRKNREETKVVEALTAARTEIQDQTLAASRLIEGKLKDAKDADGKKKVLPSACSVALPMTIVMLATGNGKEEDGA